MNMSILADRSLEKIFEFQVVYLLRIFLIQIRFFLFCFYFCRIHNSENKSHIPLILYDY